MLRFSAQVSFMHRFWEAAGAELRAHLKRAVESGQWEVATGGWVMTDEASPTVAMMLEQLVEGHQWLAQHFDSIDSSLSFSGRFFALSS